MSKYCSNCGKELQENTKFCPDCGTKTSQDDNVNQNQQVNMTNQVFSQQSIQSNIKKSKRKSGCLIIIIVVFVIIGMMIAVGSAQNQLDKDTQKKMMLKMFKVLLILK